MKKSVFCVTGAALCLILSLITAHAQDMIRAVGTATIHENAIDIARDKAIDNAQRNAVEEKMGVMITSFSEVENYQVKIDQILSESKGFINTYKIISEGRKGDIYTVTIEADVGVGKLTDRMAAIQLIMARKSMPRLILIFDEKAQKDAIADAAMARYFLSQGFKIVDADSIKKIKGHERVRTLSSDTKEVSQIARRYGAEIAILGRVEVVTKTFKMQDSKGDIEVSSNEITVSGKVVNGDTGEVITTGSKTRKGDMKTTIEEAAIVLAKVMQERMLERWASELTNVATVKLEVSGLKSYRELLRFKELIASGIKGFRQMHQRSYAHGEVELDVEIKGNAQSMADDIAAIKMSGRKIKILEITQNKIEAKLLP